MLLTVIVFWGLSYPAPPKAPKPTHALAAPLRLLLEPKVLRYYAQC